MNGRALLAWNLRRLRKDRGLSQERLAADTGIDRAYVSQLERRQGNASIDLLDRLALILEVDLVEFFIVPAPDEARPEPMRAGRRRNAIGKTGAG